MGKLRVVDNTNNAGMHYICDIVLFSSDCNWLCNIGLVEKQEDGAK
jgi:hypothetical protein